MIDPYEKKIRPSVFSEPDYPTSGRKIVLRVGNVPGTEVITVRVKNIDANETQFFAILNNDGSFVAVADISTGVPADYQSLAAEGDGSHFGSTNVVVANPPTTGPTANNRFVHVASYDNTGARQTQHSINVMLFPRAFQVSVRAENCLWLSFADAPTSPASPLPGGTFGEVVDVPFLPQLLLVPDDNGRNAPIQHVKLEADLSDRWQHDPTPGPIGDPFSTDANGRQGTTDLNADPTIAAQYRNDTLHSKNINGKTLPYNRLVGLWDFDGEGGAHAPGTTPTDEFDIGITGNAFALDTLTARPQRLFLGHQDSHHWTNNSGTIRVKVSWQN